MAIKLKTQIKLNSGELFFLLHVLDKKEKEIKEDIELFNEDCEDDRKMREYYREMEKKRKKIYDQLDTSLQKVLRAEAKKRKNRR